MRSTVNNATENGKKWVAYPRFQRLHWLCEDLKATVVYVKSRE